MGIISWDKGNFIRKSFVVFGLIEYSVLSIFCCYDGLIDFKLLYFDYYYEVVFF